MSVAGGGEGQGLKQGLPGCFAVPPAPLPPVPHHLALAWGWPCRDSVAGPPREAAEPLPWASLSFV